MQLIIRGNKKQLNHIAKELSLLGYQGYEGTGSPKTIYLCFGKDGWQGKPTVLWSTLIDKEDIPISINLVKYTFQCK